MIAPINPRVFESIAEIVEAGYSLLYMTAIPNISEHASRQIEYNKLKVSEGLMKFFSLTKQQSQKLQPVQSSMFEDVLSIMTNPVNKSALLNKVGDTNKVCNLIKIKGRSLKYSCKQCKQILYQGYISGLVATDLAEKKLFLLKLFKSSGLINR